MTTFSFNDLGKMFASLINQMDGSVQDCSISTNAMEILQSCTKSSKYGCVWSSACLIILTHTAEHEWPCSPLASWQEPEIICTIYMLVDIWKQSTIDSKFSYYSQCYCHTANCLFLEFRTSPLLMNCFLFFADFNLYIVVSCHNRVSQKYIPQLAHEIKI